MLKRSPDPSSEVGSELPEWSFCNAVLFHLATFTTQLQFIWVLWQDVYNLPSWSCRLQKKKALLNMIPCTYIWDCLKDWIRILIGGKCINKVGPVPGTWEALTLYHYSSTSSNTRNTSSFPEVLLTIGSLKELSQTQRCTFRFILSLSFIRKHEMNLLNCFFMLVLKLFCLLADSEVACKYYFHRHTSSNLVIVGNLRLSKYLHFVAHCWHLKCFTKTFYKLTFIWCPPGMMHYITDNALENILWIWVKF